MSEKQLAKLHGIFKPEKMKIRPSEIKLPTQLSLKWETVGRSDSPGTISPNASFLDNIEKYQENRFLDVGERQCKTKSWHLPHLCSGKYPVYLWLFKEIMKEVREQLVFQDHLVTAVTDWKNQIIAELKSDKKIIFIGVHNRHGSNPRSHTFLIFLHRSGGQIT